MTDTPKRRGRPPKVKEAPMAIEEPPVGIDDPGFLESMDAMIQSGLLEELTEEATADLEALAAQHAAENADLDGVSGQDRESYTDDQDRENYTVDPKLNIKPTADKFVDTGFGGLYLPVRERIVWMRGEPERHPDWLIQTELVRFEEGSYKGNKHVYLGGQMQEVPDVTGGFAIIQARVLCRLADGAEGPIIGEGTAMERSELFHDFIEKAETAAIGRALAAAGYGTEAAYDEGSNLADAPLRQKRQPFQPPPPPAEPTEIKIEASAVAGVKQGGRQANATEPQLKAIRDKARDLMLSPSALQQVVREALPQKEGTAANAFYTEEVADNPDGANDVMGYIAGLSFEECGKVVLALQSR